MIDQYPKIAEDRARDTEPLLNGLLSMGHDQRYTSWAMVFHELHISCSCEADIDKIKILLVLMFMGVGEGVLIRRGIHKIASAHIMNWFVKSVYH